MSLINSMLPLEQPVVEIEYKTDDLESELAFVLRPIVNVRCTDKNGKKFIVKIQVYWSENFKSRILLNDSKVYIKPLYKGDDFELLQPVYALSFVNETFEKSPEMADTYYHHYKIVNIDHIEKQIEGLEFVFVELPKFKPQNRAEKKLHDLWLRFLTEVNETTTEIPQELLENEFTCEAVHYMETAAYSKEQLEAYDKWKLAIMTECSAISDAKEEGEAIGLEKGKAKEKEQTVINCHKTGIDIETIATITNLTVAQVTEILKKQ